MLHANQEHVHDARYLEGIHLFNAGEFFAAHEIWEELWLDCENPDRRFYQGLIHAAVAVYHWNRGNSRGATRLVQSCRRYLAMYPIPYRGLNAPPFCDRLESLILWQEATSPPQIVLSDLESC
jgi:uncharacterized protein